MAKIQIHKPKIQIPKNIKSVKKTRHNDDKVNTAIEMINASEEALRGKDPVEALKFERIEMRKKMNWVARFSLSLIAMGTFLILLYLLFFSDLKDGHRDLINILVGAYVGVLAKSTDYWFKDKDDAEDKESQQLHEKSLTSTTPGDKENG